MGDKEKAKKVLQLIYDYEKSGVYGSDSHINARRMGKILEESKKILEKWVFKSMKASRIG